MENSKFALQLSTREGFEVKVSEALHAGKPVIASRTGGIPLQIVDGKSGYLCEPGDNAAVAQHMFDLYTDEELFDTMSEYARTHVSDEVSTVGNAAAWMYLAVMYVSRAQRGRFRTQEEPPIGHVANFPAQQASQQAWTPLEQIR